MQLSSTDLSIRPNLTLDLVQEKFSSWRESPVRSRIIPEDLWVDAIALCKIHPLGTVSKRLRLGYRDLKKRLPNEKSVENQGMTELKLANNECGRISGPALLAEIVSPRGMILRLFSPQTASIIKAFVEL